jgi:hypothetical protein
MEVKANMKAVLSQLTMVSLVWKYLAAWLATGAKVSHYSLFTWLVSIGFRLKKKRRSGQECVSIVVLAHAIGGQVDMSPLSTTSDTPGRP